MSLDHHIPRCHGGPDEASNLFPAHSICNSIKNDLMPDEFERVKKQLYQQALDNWHIGGRNIAFARTSTSSQMGMGRTYKSQSAVNRKCDPTGPWHVV